TCCCCTWMGRHAGVSETFTATDCPDDTRQARPSTQLGLGSYAYGNLGDATCNMSVAVLETHPTRARKRLGIRHHRNARQTGRCQGTFARRPECPPAGRFGERLQFLLCRRHLTHLPRVLDADLGDRCERLRWGLALQFVESRRLDIEH